MLTNPWPYLLWSLWLLVYFTVCYTMVCHASMFPLHSYFSRNHVTHDLSPLYPLIITIHNSSQTKIGAIIFQQFLMHIIVFHLKVWTILRCFNDSYCSMSLTCFTLTYSHILPRGLLCVSRENHRHVRMNKTTKKKKM